MTGARWEKRAGVISLAVALLGVVAAAVVPAASTGCTTHQCDGELANVNQGANTILGDVVVSTGTDAAFWESGSIYAPWLEYRGQETYYFGYPQYFHPLQPPTAWVSVTPDPLDQDAGNGIIALAGGQLAEMTDNANGGFLITNATCAPYYLYVSVPGTYDPPTADAGTN